MPPLKKHKIAKEEKTTEEQKIQAVINSQHQFMIPMIDAKYVRVRNPVTGLDHHFSTSDEKFLQMLWDLSQKGMKEKIIKDLNYFASNYDSKWSEVIQLVEGYLKGKETQA
jgi:hypothetical protein